VLFWLIYFIVNTLKAAVMEAPDQLDMIPRRAGVTVCGMALAYGFHLFLDRLSDWPMRKRVSAIALACVPFAAVYAAANYAAFYEIAPSAHTLQTLEKFRAEGKGEYLAGMFILEGAISWYFFFAAFGAVTLALEAAGNVADAERRAAQYQAAAREAQLKALRYQVNPHFLFNALNSLSALVMRGQPAVAEEMILKLSTFYRTSLASDVREDTPLEEELRLQRLYLDIEEVRFPSRLRVAIEAAPGVQRACVPNLILQPLVENAIKHGVARSTGPVEIRIRAWREGDSLCLSVRDDAASRPGGPDCPGTGVGLDNVRARLAARFGAAANVAARSINPGFLVELRLPYVVHGC
jgi:signal transduction histidine kinase